MSIRQISKAALGSAFLGASALLASCASNGGIDETDPIIVGGAIEPRRNLLTSDLSYGSGNGGGRGVGIDEVFRLATTTLRISPAATSTGELRIEADRQTFDDGSTLTYTGAGQNIFEFDITSEAGTFSRTFQNLLLEDPVGSTTIQNLQFGRLYGSNPGYFAGVFAGFGRQAPAPGATSGEYAAFLTALKDADLEADEDFIAALDATVSALINNSESFSYGYSFPGGTGVYYQTNMNGDQFTTGPGVSGSARTDTVAIGSYIETFDNGETVYGHHVFGHHTPLEEMPDTGTAEYFGRIVGSVLTNNAERSLTGGASMDVNFTSGLIDFRLDTSIRSGPGVDGGTTFLDYKTMTGLGVISDTNFDGTITETQGDSIGEFDGSFFGPIANEAGGTFAFGDGFSYATGAFTAKQIPD